MAEILREPAVALLLKKAASRAVYADDPQIREADSVFRLAC